MNKSLDEIMDRQILKGKTLLEAHRELNEFAEYHKAQGGIEAHKLVKEALEQWESGAKDGTVAGQAHTRGVQQGFSMALAEIRNRFVL